MVLFQCAIVLAVGLAGCSKEARPVGPELPLTPPTGASDARIDHYRGNAYQISQGGRYFLWYGCGGCHGGDGGALDLGRGHWQHGGGFDTVYTFIAHGHAGAPAAHGQQIPLQQLWQMTAYVCNLPALDAQQRRRQALDTAAEPQGRSGPAALR